jgi:DNA repair exonuclease SbcCD ATPase subunit
MAEELNNQQTDIQQEATTHDDAYAKLASGEMSLDDMMAEPTTQEPANPEPTKPAENVQPKEGEEPAEETLESYKQKSQQEIDRLNKIAKDNQAEFTRRSQELANARAELAALKEQMAQLQQANNTVDDEDLKALEDYPDDVKKLFKKLSDQNKHLESQMANMGKFVRDEEGKRAAESARQEQLRQLQADFRENVLPKIQAEEPDYDAFMRQNMAGYQQWAMTLSEGQRFSFLNSKDPRDLIQGYREYKKFLNLPYEKEAINQAVKENENKTGLYSTQAQTSRKVAAPTPKPQLSEAEAYKLEIERQMKEYSQRR